MPGDRIRKSAVRYAGAGVDDHSGGFVYHGEEFVFENDVERDIFGFEAGDGFFRQIDVDLVTIVDLVGGLCFPAVYKDVAALDQALQPRARPAFDTFGQEGVEAFSGLLLGNGQC